MRTTKRFLALFLAFLMAFGSFPTAIVAAEGEPEQVTVEQTEQQAETAPAPTAVPAAEPTAEPAAAPAAEPAPAQQPEAPAEPAPEAQPPVEAPTPGQDEYVNEYPSTPSAFTVTWKMTVDGGVQPDIQDQFAPGALLTPPEEAAQYEAQGYELTYYLDEYRTQKVDFDVDYIYVSADMTVWVDAVLPVPTEAPAPVEQAAPAETEAVEQSAQESEPQVEASAMGLDAGIMPMAANQKAMIVPFDWSGNLSSTVNSAGSYTWSTSNANVVKITGATNGKSASLQAISAGTAIVSVTAKQEVFLLGERTTVDTWQITVSPDTDHASNPNNMVRIYVYLQVDGDGASAYTDRYNDQNWLTVGYFLVPPSAVNYDDVKNLDITWYGGDRFYNQYSEAVKGYFNESTLVRYPGNADLSIDFSNVTWTDLKACFNATQYTAEDSGHAWHLNGKMTIKKQVTVTVNYVYGDGPQKDQQAAEPFNQKYNAGQSYTVDSPAIEGYVAVPASVSGLATTDVNKTVFYYQDKNKDGIPDKDQTASGSVTMEGWTYGDTPSEPVASITGAGANKYVTPPIITYYVNSEWVSEKPTDVGNYQVKAVWESAGLPSVEAVGSFTVAKRAITVHVKHDGELYVDDDGSSVAVTVESTDNLVDGHNLALAEGTTVEVDTAYVGDKDITGGLSITDVTITDGDGINVTDNYTVTFTGTAKVKDKYTVSYDWGEPYPAGEELPQDPDKYKPGEEYSVDETYYKDMKVVTREDTYNNPLEEYVFSGWNDPNNGVMGTSNVTITGTWTKQTHEESEYQHKVTYSWTDAPNEKYGEQELPVLPAEETYVTNQKYAVDTEYTASSTYNKLDEYGNVVGTWKFSGWNLEGEQTMGTDNVTITGHWTYTPAEESTYKHSVTYKWEGLEDATTSPDLPAAETYARGASYTVDTDYTAGMTFDDNGSGLYTFSGWSESGEHKMGDEDVIITGTWTKLEAPTMEELEGRFFARVECVGFGANTDTAEDAHNHNNENENYKYLLTKENTTVGELKYDTARDQYYVELKVDTDSILAQYNKDVNQQHKKVGFPNSVKVYYYSANDVAGKNAAAGWYDSNDCAQKTSWTLTARCKMRVTFKDGANGEVFKDQQYYPFSGQTDDLLKAWFNTCAEDEKAAADESGNPKRNGYVFTGWQKSTASTTSYVTFTAQWKVDTDGDGTADEDETNTITVEVIGGTAKPESPITVAFGENQTITFTPEKGYTLESVTVDGAPAELTDGAYTFENVTENHTIKVVFVKLYTVKYYDGKEEQYSEQVKDGGFANGYTPEKEHYNFKGWAAENGGQVVYGPDAEITVTSDMDLYAVWEVKIYSQDFYAYVDGLYEDEVKSSAFKLSRTLHFEDGTEITFDKDDSGVEFGFSGSPSLAPEKRTTTTIKWTVELPETVIGTRPEVVKTTYSYSGNSYVFDSRWAGTSNADSGMPEPGKTSIGLMSVALRTMTSYYNAKGGTISSTAPAWTSRDYVGQYDFGGYIAEYSMPHTDPVGATAKADPGYVFKGWYIYNGSGTPGALVTPDATLTAANMVRLSDAHSTLKSNQRFVPVFEQAEMAVAGGEWEYAYETFYPTVTFTGANSEKLTADDLGLTVQYKTEDGVWTADPIGIMHVADGPKTVYVQAVDEKGNVVCEPQDVVLTVTPHPVTLKSKDATFYYTSHEKAERSMVAGFDDNDQFFELVGKSYGVVGFTSKEYADVGFYKDAGTFTVGWYPDQPGGRPGVYASDYTVTTEFGDLTILPRKVTVNKTLTVPYTGETQSLVVDITGTATGKGDPSKPSGVAKDIYARETLSATLSALQPGTYTVKGVDNEAVVTGEGAEFSYKVLKEDNETDSTGNYDVTFDLTLIIVDAQQSVSMKGWTYGDEANEPETTDPNFEGYGEATFTYYDEAGKALPDKPVNAGSYTVKATWTGDGLPELTAEASFTIAKREILLYADNADDHFVYEGKAQTLTATKDNLEDYESDPRSGKGTYMLLADGDKLANVDGKTVYMTGTNYTVGQYKSWNNYIGKKSSPVTIVNAAGDDVTANYSGLIAMRLYIDKRQVTLTSATQTKEYDGTPLTNDTVIVTGNGFAPGEGVTWNVTGSQTIVGYSKNTFTYEANEGTNLGNYSIKKVEGTLTVTNRTNKYEITVQANSDEVTYDGKNHEVEGFKSLSFDVEGNTYTVEGLSASASGKDAGTYDSKVTGTAVVKDAAGNDVTAQFTVKTEDGKLTINKKAATVTSASAEKEYDGTELTAPEVTGEGFVEGEGVTGTATGSQTLVGSSENEFTYEAEEGTNLDNYTITETKGTLTVKDRTEKYEITVTAKSDEVTYDGAEHSVSGFESLTFEVEGNTYTVEGLEASASGTDAAEYPSEVTGTAVVKDAAGNDVTAQFTVTTVDGKLTITAKPVVDPDDPANSVTVQKPGDVKYNGESQQEKPVITDGDTPLVEGKDYELKYTEDTTNAGTVTVTVEFEGNYQGTESVTYEITPRTVTMTSGSNTWTYNGEPHSQPTVTESGDGFVTGQGAEYSGFASITGQGTVSNTFTHTLKEGTLARNYTIADHVNGTLTVTPAPAAAMAVNAPANFLYDGAAHQWAPTVTGVGGAALTAGTDYTVTYSTADFTNVTGAITVTITGIGNYSGAVTRTYQITPRPVTLTSGSGAKVYDGTPLTNGTMTVGGSGFAPGEGAAYTFTGSQTAVGTSPNSFTYALTGGAQARNYTITTVPGTLTVTPAGAAAMTVNAPGGFLYDGAAHQWIPTVTGVGGAALTEGTDYTVTYSTADFTDAGTITATITGIGNYSGTVTRTYQITPRTVVLTAAGATRVYNGAALTNGTVTVGGNGFAPGEGAAYNVTGSQTNAGSSANTFTYTLNGNTNAANYRITALTGTLTVTPAALAANTPGGYQYDGTSHRWAPTVTGVGGQTLTAGTDYTVTYSTANVTDAGTVTATVTGQGNYAGTLTRTYQITPRTVVLVSASATKTFDGTALRAQNVTVGGSGFARGEGATYNVTGRQTAAGTSANTFTYTLNANTDADNYRITTINGTLTVTAAAPADDEGGNEPGPAGGVVDIPEDETPLGETPEETPEESPEPTDEAVPADDEDQGPDYLLSEEVVIDDNDTPLGSGPAFIEQECCILHFVLMLCALAVAVYYTHDRKKRQAREFELRSEL